MAQSVIIPTIIETIGMQVWLGLAALSLGPIGLIILATALTIEHSLIRKSLGTLGLNGVLKGGVVSVIETILWGIGLFIWHLNPVGSAIFLLLAINAEHTIQDNYFEGLGLFSKLFNPGRLDVTSIEIAGFAVAMIIIGIFGPVGAIIGAPLFFIANLTEHKKIVASDLLAITK